MKGGGWGAEEVRSSLWKWERVLVLSVSSRFEACRAHLVPAHAAQTEPGVGAREVAFQQDDLCHLST